MSSTPPNAFFVFLKQKKISKNFGFFFENLRIFLSPQAENDPPQWQKSKMKIFKKNLAGQNLKKTSAGGSEHVPLPLCIFVFPKKMKKNLQKNGSHYRFNGQVDRPHTGRSTCHPTQVDRPGRRTPQHPPQSHAVTPLYRWFAT